MKTQAMPGGEMMEDAAMPESEMAGAYQVTMTIHANGKVAVSEPMPVPGIDADDEVADDEDTGSARMGYMGGSKMAESEYGKVFPTMDKAVRHVMKTMEGETHGAEEDMLAKGYGADESDA